MPHGGKRPGAGRPKELVRAAAQLDRVRDKLHTEFYISAGELAKAMPQLTRQAIQAATGLVWKDAEGKEHSKPPDLTMLKFLIELFWKIVSAMPGNENQKAKEMRAQFLAIVNNYTSQRPEALDSDGKGRVIEAESVTDLSDDGAVLRHE